MSDLDLLDDLDLKMLDTIQKNPPLSTAELADLVGLSQSPCWRRLARLKAAGYILDQVTRLDPEKLGFSTVVFASVSLSAHGKANLTEFIDAIARFAEVVECHATMGSADFMLRIITRDVADYREFVFSRLSTLPTVHEIHSTMTMGTTKSTTVLPIRRR
jgi:Lrp/AsnC family transcriptional regulator